MSLIDTLAPLRAHGQGDLGRVRCAYLERNGDITLLFDDQR